MSEPATETPTQARRNLLSKMANLVSINDSPLVNSQILGVSTRSLVTLGLVGTVCYMAIKQVEIGPFIASATLLALKYHFDQKP